MKIAINGFGRIGRTFLRLALAQDFEVVAINDLSDLKTMMHLLKYDSVHGPLPYEIEQQDDTLLIGHQRIRVFAQANAALLPWDDLGVEVVLDCTGRHLTYDKAAVHLKAGAKKVLLSAPAADDIPMLVLGVNDEAQIFKAPIISNASCTTNNIAPMIQVLDRLWGVVEGYITTVHSMTGDQNLHDGNHRDLRRARAASASIIPTSTGAAKAITAIFPKLDGHLGGAGIRVPVLNGSLTDFTCRLKKPTTVAAINEAFKKASQEELQGILQYTEDPIVSVDVINNPHSCVFDAGLTSIVGDLVKVVGWYDNEYGYSSRLIDVLKKIKAEGY